MSSFAPLVAVATLAQLKNTLSIKTFGKPSVLELETKILENGGN